MFIQDSLYYHLPIDYSHVQWTVAAKVFVLADGFRLSWSGKVQKLWEAEPSSPTFAFRQPSSSPSRSRFLAFWFARSQQRVTNRRCQNFVTLFGFIYDVISFFPIAASTVHEIISGMLISVIVFHRELPRSPKWCESYHRVGTKVDRSLWNRWGHLWWEMSTGKAYTISADSSTDRQNVDYLLRSVCVLQLLDHCEGQPFWNGVPQKKSRSKLKQGITCFWQSIKN